MELSRVGRERGEAKQTIESEKVSIAFITETKKKLNVQTISTTSL